LHFASIDTVSKQAIIWITVILLIASWLFPYWVWNERGTWGYHSDGFYFLFDRWNVNKHIDRTRLVLVDLVIVAIAGGLLFTFRRGRYRVTRTPAAAPSPSTSPSSQQTKNTWIAVGAAIVAIIILVLLVMGVSHQERRSRFDPATAVPVEPGK
jgi:hypothetical protein